MTAKKYIPAGTVFNSLTYLHDVPRDSAGARTAVFRCACGAEKIMFLANVTSGKSKSCGCESRQATIARSTTHGMSRTATYRSWSHMLDRCYNPKDKRYPDYGGRGIRVCDRWAASFENFLADMGEKPAGRTIDRIENNIGYQPGNCRWATAAEQANNRRSNIVLRVDGMPSRIADVSDKLGLSYETMRRRIQYSKMTDDKKYSNEKIKRITLSHDGLSMSIKEWSARTGVAAHTIDTRLRRGKTVAEALAPIKPQHRK